MKIIIIDDKINSCELLKHTEKIYLVNENNKVNEIDKYCGVDHLVDSHSDTCGKIILKYCPKIQIINIVIKDMHNGRIDKFLKGIEYASRIEGDIVNISLGVTDDRYAKKIHDYIRKLRKSNKEIVCAYSNNKVRTYPASFKEVIGCMAEKMDNNIVKSKIINELGKVICVNANHIIRNNTGEIVMTGGKNSYATAYMTSLIARNKIYC